MRGRLSCGSSECHISPNRYASYEAIVAARALPHARVSTRVAKESARGARVIQEAVIEFAVTGILAWRGGQPGQVGNEAATAVFHQCRGSGSSPSALASLSSCCSCRGSLTARHRSGLPRNPHVSNPSSHCIVMFMLSSIVRVRLWLSVSHGSRLAAHQRARAVALAARRC